MIDNSIFTHIIKSVDNMMFEQDLNDFYNKYNDLYDIECHYFPLQTINNTFVNTALLIARRKCNGKEN